MRPREEQEQFSSEVQAWFSRLKAPGTSGPRRLRRRGEPLPVVSRQRLARPVLDLARAGHRERNFPIPPANSGRGE